MTDDDTAPPPPTKLTATKTDWASSRRGIAAAAPERQRLPPGQHLTSSGLPILDLGTQPNLVPADWALSCGGLVDAPLRWSWADLLKQPQITLTADIHCVTSWSSYDNTFTGVPFRHFLRQIHPRAGATHAMLRSFDGYSTNLPLSDLDRDDVLICHQWNGKPLPRENGGPVRLLVPHLYFWKSAKWLRHITVMDRDQPGYWEARGYHMRGDPWRQERYGD
ncbi:sulfite oxidase-like oxidoreductase [Novispirillum itersonii]|uniref:DMSO/TMAO reductase YedYZ molybdopterin-dependent catalytic subunit n=1 Tax=Novispirillum itersonii TaxID=189 RepID=A0A7W9ZH00_NOVIT|nr:sulfite oxidase-like oxidoreductase [Novispirillum itersonii]MBB6210104.1 DMSO/TMAO reductase YedYZ molybdopterin-dependent catalytic subunit [Novispirillum itersonii]